MSLKADFIVTQVDNGFVIRQGNEIFAFQTFGNMIFWINKNYGPKEPQPT